MRNPKNKAFRIPDEKSLAQKQPNCKKVKKSAERKGLNQAKVIIKFTQRFQETMTETFIDTYI